MLSRIEYYYSLAFHFCFSPSQQQQKREAASKKQQALKKLKLSVHLLLKLPLKSLTHSMCIPFSLTLSLSAETSKLTFNYTTTTSHL